MTEWNTIDTAPRQGDDEEVIYCLFYDKNTDFVFQGWMDMDGDVWACGAPYDSSAGWTPTHWAVRETPARGEWLMKCAKRYEDKAEADSVLASELAEACLENVDGDLSEDPVDCADEDMSCWTE